MDILRDIVGNCGRALRLLWKAAGDYWDRWAARRHSLLDCATALYREDLVRGAGGL